MVAHFRRRRLASPWFPLCRQCFRNNFGNIYRRSATSVTRLVWRFRHTATMTHIYVAHRNFSRLIWLIDIRGQILLLKFDWCVELFIAAFSNSICFSLTFQRKRREMPRADGSREASIFRRDAAMPDAGLPFMKVTPHGRRRRRILIDVGITAYAACIWCVISRWCDTRSPEPITFLAAKANGDIIMIRYYSYFQALQKFQIIADNFKIFHYIYSPRLIHYERDTLTIII